MLDVDDGDLVVIARLTRKVRQRVIVQQRQSLGTDLALWDLVAGNRRPGGGIHKLDGLALRIQNLRKISHAFGCVRHESRTDGGNAIPGPLVVNKKIGAVANEVRNLDRTAECKHTLRMVIGEPRRVLARQRKWTGVER